jgi:fluoride exporter
VTTLAYYLAVAIGGALGAVSRYWMISWVESLSAVQAGQFRFPWGTLAVNVLGSLLIGILFVLISEKALISAEWRAILVVGYIGAFTTFSTFSLDALLLMQHGQLLQAAAYIVSSVLVCILFAWLGIAAARAV